MNAGEISLISKHGVELNITTSSRYAGIGARATPVSMLHRMETLARELAQHGLALRSGCAAGADTAFERGARAGNGALELFIPWAGYRGDPAFGTRCPGRDSVDVPGKPVEAERIAAVSHPAWHRCGRGVRALHGRNVAILLGKHHDAPVDFVVCWMNPARPGGTGMGVAIARRYRIPVVNLFDDR